MPRRAKVIRIRPAIKTALPWMQKDLSELLIDPQYDPKFWVPAPLLYLAPIHLPFTMYILIMITSDIIVSKPGSWVCLPFLWIILCVVCVWLVDKVSIILKLITMQCDQWPGFHYQHSQIWRVMSHFIFHRIFYAGLLYLKVPKIIFVRKQHYIFLFVCTFGFVNSLQQRIFQFIIACEALLVHSYLANFG